MHSRVHPVTHLCSSLCTQIVFQWRLSYIQTCVLGQFLTLWRMKCIGFCSMVIVLTPLPFLPPTPPPAMVEGVHMQTIEAWRMHTVRRVCHSQHGAWLGKMEGGPVSHATRLVAILTLVCLRVWVGGGGSGCCSGVRTYVSCLNTPSLPPAHTHIRPPVVLQSVDIHSASKRGGTTKGPGNR